MKKILVLFIIVTLIVGCNKNINQNSIIDVTTNSEYNSHIYYELENRYIYAYNNIDSIKFTYNEETKELSDWFKEKEHFIDIFTYEISKASSHTITNPNDKVTKEYHLGDIGIVFCNFRNSNIIIGVNIDYKTAKCPETEKKIKYNKLENDIIVNIYDINSYYGKNYNCNSIDKIQYFYEDDIYKYFINNCENLIVAYGSGYEESLYNAFKNSTISLYDLDLYDIKYEKIKK